MKKIYLYLLLIIVSFFSVFSTYYTFALLQEPAEIPWPTCKLSYTPSGVVLGQKITGTLTSTNVVITKMGCAPKGQAITLSTKCGSSNCGSNGSWSVATSVAQETTCKVEVTNSAGKTATCSASYIVEGPEPVLPPPPPPVVPLPTCKLSYTPSGVLLGGKITGTLTSTNAVISKMGCAPKGQAITLSTKCGSSNCGSNGSWSVATSVAQETNCRVEVTNSAGKTATCSASYIVEGPEPVAPPVVKPVEVPKPVVQPLIQEPAEIPWPTCKLSYTPSGVVLGQKITGTLTSTNAVISKMGCAPKGQAITLSTKCGSSNCGLNGSWSVATSVAQETNCRVEVTNSAGKTATCDASYVVEGPEPVQPVIQPVVKPLEVPKIVEPVVQPVVKTVISKNITGLEPECNTQYVPVCGVKYLQSCQSGANSCSTIPIYKTFTNSCELKNNKAKFVFNRNGSCESIVGSSTKLADNSSIQLTDNSSIKLTDKIELQLNQSINNLLVKINQNYTNKVDKVNYINTIISKLQTIEKNQPKYMNVTQYLINKLNDEISKIGVDGSSDGIDEILNIFN